MLIEGYWQTDSFFSENKLIIKVINLVLYRYVGRERDVNHSKTNYPGLSNACTLDTRTCTVHVQCTERSLKP